MEIATLRSGMTIVAPALAMAEINHNMNATHEVPSQKAPHARFRVPIDAVDVQRNNFSLRAAATIVSRPMAVSGSICLTYDGAGESMQLSYTRTQTQAPLGNQSGQTLTSPSFLSWQFSVSSVSPKSATCTEMVRQRVTAV